MQKEKKEILVVGLAVRDVVVLANGKEKVFFGGTGANISYGLGMLGVSPVFLSVAGKDFNSGFAQHLKKHGVNLKVFTDKKEETAVFLIVKQKNGKQIESWHPNVFNKIEKLKLSSLLSKKDFGKIKIAIFSPGTPISIINHLREFSKNKIKDSFVIFDPGQMTHHYSKEQFTECCKLCDMLILNELEFKQSNKKLEGKLLELFKDKILIKTLGEKGSDVFLKGKKNHVMPIKVRKVVSVVGAGDAYRAGLIYGLSKKLDLISACKLGAQLASKNVECLGCQEYSFKIK